MRKKFGIELAVIAVCLLLAACTFVGCKKKQQQPEQEYFLAFRQDAIAVTVGDTVELGYILYKGDTPVSDAEVAFSASSAIVTFDGNKMTATAAGETVVTVRFGDMRDSMTVTVAEKEPVLYVVKLDRNEQYLYADETATLTATVTADGKETDIAATFTSSDTSVVNVSSDGKLTPVALGTATVRAEYGGNYDCCTVCVEAPVEITVAPSARKMAIGSKQPLSAEVDGETAETKDLRFRSWDESVVTVEDGQLVAVGVGKTKVAVLRGSTEADVEVEVYDYAIRSPADFARIADNLSASYYLAQDIDFAGIDYVTPAHWNVSASGTIGFSGRLDGNGKTVKNLDLSYTGVYTNSNALIGIILKNGVVENLNVEVSGHNLDRAGAICNVNYGIIRNCYVKIGNVSSKDNATYAFGGISNQSRGTIECCIVDYAKASLSGNVAGIVGRTYSGALYRNCFVVAGANTVKVIFNENNAAPDLSTCHIVSTASEMYRYSLDAFDAWTLDREGLTIPVLGMKNVQYKE